MKKFLLLILALVLTACASNAAAGASEFSQNQEKWEDANITHYRFNLDMVCFCAFRDQMPLTIEVRDGQVVSITNNAGTEVLDTDPSYEFFMPYATIAQLFAELDANLNGNADEVTVKYDETYGFPTELNIDFVKEAVDDELYLTVSGFEPLP